MSARRGGPPPLFPAGDPLAGPLATLAQELRAPVLPEFEVPEDEPFAMRVQQATSRPTASQSETAIVAEMLKWLNVQPLCHARKVHQSAVTGSGEPDLLICWRGRMVVVEVKRPGEHPTRKQLRRLLTWQEAGALVGWATSLDDLRMILARADDPTWHADLAQPGAPAQPVN